MTTTLGTIGNRVDLSHQYAAGSYQLDVHFMMDGLQFRAQRFVRTDGRGCDNVDLYIKHESSWCDDFVGRVRGELYLPEQQLLLASRVTARALHLLAVADATIPADTAERFAQIELV